MSSFRKSAPSRNKTYNSKHRFEHWYRDNQIYFITARCRDRFPAFAASSARKIFWDQFDAYARQHNFTPIITSLLNNHYHTLGYLQTGRDLGPMMQKLHGSVAKLVNDTLPERRTPFWHDARNRDYFDGCIRDEKQFRRAYRYVQTQAVRSGLSNALVDVRVTVEMERALARAVEKKALLWGVDYKRYSRDGRQAR